MGKYIFKLVWSGSSSEVRKVPTEPAEEQDIFQVYYSLARAVQLAPEYLIQLQGQNQMMAIWLQHRSHQAARAAVVPGKSFFFLLLNEEKENKLKSEKKERNKKVDYVHEGRVFQVGGLRGQEV